MKDWEWFALGLVPFASAPTQMIRYFVEDHTPTAGQIAASAVGSQVVAYGIQRAGLYKLNEALMLYRLGQLGFVDEGLVKGTGETFVRRKVVTARTIGGRGSGVAWRPTFAMRMLTPLMLASLIGAGINIFSSPVSHSLGIERRTSQAHSRDSSIPEYI